MKFSVGSRQAKRFARALEKVLAKDGIKLAHGKAMEVLAQTQGFENWNEWVNALKPETLNKQLHPIEINHIQHHKDVQYGKEVEVRAHTGFALRYDGRAPTCEYVRTVDPIGREIAYWHSDEWQRDPQRVMGAILGSLARDEALSVQQPKAALPSLKHNFAVYTSTFWEGDALRIPQWAKMVVTPPVLAQILKLRAIVRQEKLDSVSVRSAPQVWDGELDEADPLRVELGKLVVDAEDFWFEAKTTEELPVETCPIDIDQLLEAFSAREHAQGAGWVRRGHIVIFENGTDEFAHELAAAGEDMSEWFSRR